MASIQLVKEYLDTKEDFPVKAKLIDVKILSGGLANHVYRLLFEDNSTKTARQKKLQSPVLFMGKKHKNRRESDSIILTKP